MSKLLAALPQVISAVKKGASLLALWFAKRAGKKEAEREALEEHAERVEDASRARHDAELGSVFDDRDYRD